MNSQLLHMYFLGRREYKNNATLVVINTVNTQILVYKRYSSTGMIMSSWEKWMIPKLQPKEKAHAELCYLPGNKYVRKE